MMTTLTNAARMILERPYLAGFLVLTLTVGYGMLRALEMLRAVQGVG